MTNTESWIPIPYISDAAAYAEIVAILKASEEKDFIHLVTMQNHTPYQDKYTVTPSVAETGIVSQTIRNYLQDLQYSDQLWRICWQLCRSGMSRLSSCFGGIIGRVFSRGSLCAEYDPKYASRRLCSSTATRKKPIRIWASPVHLFLPEVLELSGSRVTAFEALLMALQEQVPAFEKTLYVNGDTGEYVSSREGLSDQARSLLADYDLIQYDTTTGNRYAESNGFSK